TTFVYDDDGILRVVNDRLLRRFLHEYVMNTVKEDDVKNFIALRLGKDMSWTQLELLKGIKDPLSSIEQFAQSFNYRNTAVRVTPDSIEEVKLPDYLWENMVIPRKFERVPIFEEFSYHEGNMRCTLTEAGERCEMLRFLRYTSEFSIADAEERNRVFVRNFFNKVTAIGFLLTKFKSEFKAVVMVDGTESSGNTADGRTGKSLLGKALSHFANVATIDGRNTKNSDSFVFFNVDRTTDLIFMEDIRSDYNFENLYNCITSDLTVNRKNKEQFVIPISESPKFLIATNYMIKDRSRSAEHRIAYMLFSDHYNQHRMPVDDFGHMLFDGWMDGLEEQWVLFDNLMLECAQLYLRSLKEQWQSSGSGIINASYDIINARNYRMLMGDTFFEWIT
ncbi:MAG: hypothetical protein HUK03_10220, partial [Bacteroidaceae bacterium]|nr:hypothetical protein [Bacteroidaceae bacterium]